MDGTALQIGAGRTHRLGKAQQRFNTLVKKVGKLRAALAAWTEAQPALHRQIVEHERLRRAHVAALTDLVLLLERSLGQRGLGARQAALLRELVLEMTVDLVGAGATALKATYRRLTGRDYDKDAAREEAATARMMQSVLEDHLGVELDKRFSDLDELEAAARAELDQQEAAAEARRARRKKTAKQQAREERQAAEHTRVTKVLQDVYRKLARALHPDHERDAGERARKTALMQEVNAAYAAKDLLTLLELQLRFEQLERADIETLADDRLAQFNQLLAQQVKELEHELLLVAEPWCEQLGVERLTAPRALVEMQALLDDLAEATEDVRRDLGVLGDVRALKRWIIAQRLGRG